LLLTRKLLHWGFFLVKLKSSLRKFYGLDLVDRYGISVSQMTTDMFGELMCSERVSSSCSTSDTRRVNLVTNPVISHEWGKDREMFTTSGTYPWSFVTQIFNHGQPIQMKRDNTMARESNIRQIMVDQILHKKIYQPTN
jgi:hypothetical protein